MAWERGYYYRVRKVGGRVVREYIGRGPAAELIAELDAFERAEKEHRRFDRAAEADRWADLDRRVTAFCELADLMAEAAFLAAGYHRHKRGEWRKRRVRPC